MKKFFEIVILVLSVLLLFVYILKYLNLISYYVPASENNSQVLLTAHHDDTLRIAFVGDSWAEFHQKEHNCRIPSMLSRELRRPVIIRNGGISGLTSKQIYNGLFEECSIKKTIEWGPDICIIVAGVNDSDRKMGTYYYQESMRLIINFLLKKDILPVVLEIPYFNSWRSFRIRSASEKIKYITSMVVNFSNVDCVDSYRKSFESMIVREHWNNRIIYVKCNSWNPAGYNDKREIYDELQMHLNENGYCILDVSIAKHIVDYMTNS